MELDGIVLKPNLTNFSKQVNEDNIIYTCGSGLLLSKIANIALEDEVTGVEFAFGIPGSLGGAIYMNSGAYGSEIKDIVLETKYLDMDGNYHIINNNEHDFKYRSSIFQRMNAVIIESKLVLKKGIKSEIKVNMEENMQSRKSKQPLEYPSAGSVFKRGEGFITAKLIDECGLKGTKIGDAEISEKHAGFIINKGNATSKDVLSLIDFIKKDIKEKKNIDIEEEILIIGEN